MARHSAKFERCVKDVKRSGTAKNPWAVCHAALGGKHHHRRDPGHDMWDLYRDGQYVTTGTSFDIASYIHKHHSYSVDHALKYEGYEMRPAKKVSHGRRAMRSRRHRDPVPPSGRRRVGSTSSGIPSQREYESREIATFHADLKRVEKAPLNERKEDAKEFAEAMASDPALVAERIGWLLDGNYGYGSYVKSREVVRSKMNAPAWLTQVIGALEWRSPFAMTRANWNKLSSHQKAELARHVEQEIRDHLSEGE
jgi:hypothetical protein